jgi:hypothetical protein
MAMTPSLLSLSGQENLFKAIKHSVMARAKQVYRAQPLTGCFMEATQ